jgi:hypothetical protein
VTLWGAAMTYVEVLTLLISLLSVVVAFVSLWRTTRLQKRMTKAEEAQGRLAERKLAALDEDAQRARKADLRVKLEAVGRAHRFVIENYGPAGEVRRHTLILAAGTRIAIPPSLSTQDAPLGASVLVTVTRSDRGEWTARRIEQQRKRNSWWRE